MGPEAWKRSIGESAWQHVFKALADDGLTEAKVADREAQERAVADVLTAAVEAGFRAPEQAPIVDPAGTKVLWPVTDQHTKPMMTALGLMEHWQRRGHGFLLLRVPQLLRAVAGPLLARFQEVLHAYEEECRADGLHPTPTRWRVFVGGDQHGISFSDLGNYLWDVSPDAQKPDHEVTVQGPDGDRS